MKNNLTPLCSCAATKNTGERTQPITLTSDGRCSRCFGRPPRLRQQGPTDWAEKRLENVRAGRRPDQDLARAKAGLKRKAKGRPGQYEIHSRTPKFYHSCAKCGKRIQTKWKFCRDCNEIKRKRRRPNVDALTRRLPGSITQ
jgi:hypothetical protein